LLNETTEAFDVVCINYLIASNSRFPVH